MAKEKMDDFLSASDNSHRSESNPSSDLSDERRDWSGLPAHLLSDIADNFTSLDDYVTFGRVCTSWQAVFLHNVRSLGSPLLLVDPPDDKDYLNRRALYSLSKKGVCDFKVPLPHSKSCRGSSFGWLITMEEKGKDNYHVQLQNPFLSRTINLPTLDNIVQLHPDEFSGALFPGEYLWKATISSDPSSSDEFIIMARVSRYSGLAYFKPGNPCWTPIEGHWAVELDTMFEDVIFYHKASQFYALRYRGTLVAIKFCGNEQKPELIQIAPPLDAHLLSGSANKHLVEDLATGDLLQVCRKDKDGEKDQNGKQHIITQFLVFKFNPLEQSWRQIRDLGGKVLFVGLTCSVLRSASDCSGCVPNCIYFTSEPYMAGYNRSQYYKHILNGVYNLEDDTIQEHYSTDKRRAPATIWLEPTLPIRN